MVHSSMKAKAAVIAPQIPLRDFFLKETLRGRGGPLTRSSAAALVSAFTPSPSTCNGEDKYPNIGFNVSAFEQPAIKMTSGGPREWRRCWREADACSRWFIIRTGGSTR